MWSGEILFQFLLHPLRVQVGQLANCSSEPVGSAFRQIFHQSCGHDGRVVISITDIQLTEWRRAPSFFRVLPIVKHIKANHEPTHDSRHARGRPSRDP